MGSPELISVAIYRRTLQASLERVWENALDWEHLPWLHRSTFRSIEKRGAGRWGWRARVGLQPAEGGREIEIELRVDRAKQRYAVYTLGGPGAGTEIWTRLESASGRRTAIEVEFLVPGIDREGAAGLGQTYTQLYTRLWDEDESMMVRRERLLAQRRADVGAADGAPLDLGPLERVRAQLSLRVELGGQPVRLVALDGELVAHSAVCPHLLGPLDEGELEEGCVRCPWHGYRFDLRGGRSADGRGLRLGPAPRVEIDPRSSHVRLVWERRRS